MSVVTVNHHGVPDQVTFSGPLSAFSSMGHHGDKNMYVCVHKEPISGVPEVDIEPHVSVDWVAFYNGLGSAESEIYGIHTVIRGSLFCRSGILNYNYDTGAIKTILLNAPPLSLFNVTNEGGFWIDSYRHTVGDGSKHTLELCVQIANAPNEAPLHHFEFFLLTFFEESVVNYGLPPSPDSYLTENGNMKLEVLESFIKGWSLLCADYPFIQSYTSTPFVFISVSFREKVSSDVIEPAVSSWVEFVNEVGFRACVGRPRYTGEIPLDASMPYLEYLVISQDGILDSQRSDLFNMNLFITLELEFPIPIAPFLNAYDSFMFGVILMFQEFSSGRWIAFFNYGYAEHTDARIVYLFVSYSAQSEEDATVVQSKLMDTFVDGYFPYVPDHVSYDVDRLMEAMYSNVEPQDDAEKIKANVWFDWGCVVGPFTSGTCSVPECSSNTTSGIKTITRELVHDKFAGSCPPLSIDIPCNLPPCFIHKDTFYTIPNPYRDSDGTDLTWLWAIIGVFAGIAVIGCGYAYYSKTRNSESILGN